jgi:hypothetical protein
MLLLLTGGAASNGYEFGTSRFVPRRMEDVECDEGRVADITGEPLSVLGVLGKGPVLRVVGHPGVEGERSPAHVRLEKGLEPHLSEMESRVESWVLRLGGG